MFRASSVCAGGARSVWGPGQLSSGGPSIRSLRLLLGMRGRETSVDLAIRSDHTVSS
jgi:hypothetical protein